MTDDQKEAVLALIDAAYNALGELDHWAVGEQVQSELEEACERVRELL